MSEAKGQGERRATRRDDHDKFACNCLVREVRPQETICWHSKRHIGGQRRSVPFEAAFNCANVLWPTSGVSPMWVSGGKPHGRMWPECCRFVVLPESQSQWLIMRHGSIIVVVPASIGLKTTDQAWHYEQWLHLMFAGCKRRRDASPADSKSRQKCQLHTSACTTSVGHLLALEPLALFFTCVDRTVQLPNQPFWTCSAPLSSYGDLAGCSLPLFLPS